MTARTAIVVDDEQDMSLLIELQVGLAGFEVVGSGRDGTDAVHHWETNREAGTPLDAVVIDHHLPTMDGLDAAIRIREADPDVRIILISAGMTAELAMRAKAAGVDHAIPKSRLSELPDLLA